MILKQYVIVHKGSLKKYYNARRKASYSNSFYEFTDEKTVSDIKHKLIARGEPWTLLAEQDVLIVLNQTLTSESSTVSDGDEIAFFPPVTGG